MNIATVYLLTMFVCNSYTTDNDRVACTLYYDVYPTQARCDVALSKWFEKGVPVSQDTSYCRRENLTADDIAVYQSRRYTNEDHQTSARNR